MSRGQNSKERILESATELFFRVGYHATSIDDILKQCNVAKSNFYYHYQSKEQLGFAVLERQLSEYEALLLQSLRHPQLAPGEQLRAFFAALCRLQAEVSAMGGCPFGNMAAALSSTQDARDERFRQQLAECFDRMEAALRDCLAAGMQQSVFRSDTRPEDLAAFILAALQGLLLITKTRRDVRPLKNGIAVIETFLKPIAPRG